MRRFESNLTTEHIFIPWANSFSHKFLSLHTFSQKYRLFKLVKKDSKHTALITSLPHSKQLSTAVHYSSCSQRVAPGSAASASTGSLLEMHSLGPTTDPLGQELCRGDQKAELYWFWYLSDKHWTPALSILWSLLSEGHPIMAPRPTVQPLVCVHPCVHSVLCYREEALHFHAFLPLLRWLLCLECSPLPYPLSPYLMLYLNALPGLNAGRHVSDEGCSLFLEAKMVISSYSWAL